MPDAKPLKPPKTPKPRQPSKPAARRSAATAVVDDLPAPMNRIRDLACAGRHAAAIELASAALGATDVGAGARLELLERRAESLMAEGDLKRAGADAAAMKRIAQAT